MIQWADIFSWLGILNNIQLGLSVTVIRPLLTSFCPMKSFTNGNGEENTSINMKIVF